MVNKMKDDINEIKVLTIIFLFLSSLSTVLMVHHVLNDGVHYQADSVVTIDVEKISELPAGVDLVCTEGVVVEKLNCPSCSWWAKGHGQCSYVKKGNK